MTDTQPKASERRDGLVARKFGDDPPVEISDGDYPSTYCQVEVESQRAYVIFSVLACEYADKTVFGKIRCTCKDGYAACHHLSLLARYALNHECFVAGEKGTMTRSPLYTQSLKKTCLQSKAAAHLLESTQTTKRANATGSCFR